MIQESCLALVLSAIPASGNTIGLSCPEEAELAWGPWSVLLPFDHPGGGIAVEDAHSPERQLKPLKLNGEGPDFGRKWKGKNGKPIQWRPVRTGEAVDADFGVIDFLTLIPDDYPDKGEQLTRMSAAYVHRSLRSPSNQKIKVSFGSDDGARIWLNGKLVHDKPILRGVNPTDDLLELDLRSGTNHLLVKVCNEGGAWGCQLIDSPTGESPAVETPRSTIEKAIEMGAVYLLKTQNLDGSWSYEGKKYRNGQTSLSLYALMKSGLTEDHPAVRRGMEFLRTHPPKMTYSASVQILALVAMKNDRHSEWIEDLAMVLMDWQEGGFGYPSGQNDLSNTQYGALGLWAAMKVGVDIPQRVWLYLLRNSLNHQNDDGGFGYRIGGASTGSMTVAGLTIIAICQQGYGVAGVPSQLERKTEKALESGLNWLAENFRSDKNPRVDGGGEERWKHYYLYGIERLAALLGIDEIGQYDWYRQGSAYYVKSQTREGSWVAGGAEPESNTAFGLIFLSRGTASMTGTKSSSHASRRYATDGEGAEIVLRASGDTPLTMWLSEISEAATQDYARDGAGGNGVYLDKAEYLANGETIAIVEADATKPWKADTLATQYKFSTRGDHEIQLRVHLAPDPAVPGSEPQIIESPKVTVRIDKLLESWMLDYPDDSLQNLVLDQRKTVSASSKRGDGGKPALAIDGLAGTAWISSKTDAEPSLTIDFKRAVRADRVVLSHVSSKELLRHHFDRATKVSVELGGKREPQIFELDRDEERKSILILSRSSKISQITIRVLERDKGQRHPGHVGFAEIELRKGE